MIPQPTILIIRPRNRLFAVVGGSSSSVCTCRDETDGGCGDGIGVEDPVPGDWIVGVDFFVGGAVLLEAEDGVADGEGVVEGLRRGRVGGGGGGGETGGGRGAGGEDDGTGGWEEGDCVGRVRGGHVEEMLGVVETIMALEGGVQVRMQSAAVQARGRKRTCR